MKCDFVTLGSIVQTKGLQTGPFGSQLKAAEYTESGIPVVMPKDIIGGRISERTIARVPEAKAQSLAKHRLQEGDVVFARRGDLGRIAIVGSEHRGWLCGTGCLRVRIADELLDSSYLYYYTQLSAVQRWLEHNALGQTMLNINTEILSRLPIYMVSSTEQSRTVGLLAEWDHMLDTLERLIVLKERRFAWLLQRARVAEGEHRRINLGDLLAESREPDLEGDPRKRLTVRLYLKGVEVRDYRGTEVKGGTRYYRRATGQFIYGKQNIFKGAFGIVPEALDGYCSTQDIPCFDVAESVLPKWLYYYFSLPGFYRRLEMFATGSGAKRLQPADLFNIAIDVPSLERQAEVVALLDAVQEEIALLNDQLKLYQKQKQGLMVHLFTGGIRLCKSQMKNPVVCD